MPLDLTKRYQTADGRKVLMLNRRVHPIHPLFGLLQEADGSQSMNSWTEDGQCIGEPNCDLKHEPITLKRYFCMYVDKRAVGLGINKQEIRGKITQISTNDEARYAIDLHHIKQEPDRFVILDEKVYEYTIDEG